MDGLRPNMTTFITASLFSKTNKDALWLEVCECGGAWSILSVNLLSVMRDFFFLILLCMGLPPAGLVAPICDLVLLCENTCLLFATPATRHKCVASQMCTTILLTLIWSPSGCLRSRHQGRDLVCILMQRFPHDNIVDVRG